MVSLPSVFGKKGDNKPSPSSRVKTLSAQGLPETEIIRTLRGEGYSAPDVDRGMRTALKEAVGSASPSGSAAPERSLREPVSALPELPGLGSPVNPPGASDPFAPPAEARPASQPLARPPMERAPPAETPPLMEEFPPMGPPPPAEAPPAQAWHPSNLDEEMPPLPSIDRDRGPARSEIEEVAEMIIDEKWQNLERNIGDVIKKLDSLGSRVSALETTSGQAKGLKGGEVDSIKTSLEAYKSSMTELGSRMEGMERAIKDSLTPMMQSLRSLSDTVRIIKQPQPPKK